MLLNSSKGKEKYNLEPDCYNDLKKKIVNNLNYICTAAIIKGIIKQVILR